MWVYTLRKRGGRRPAVDRHVNPIRRKLLQVYRVCYICGVECDAETATIDHYVPKSRGGSSAWSNLRLACRNCNNRKGSKLPDEIGELVMPAIRNGYNDQCFSAHERGQMSIALVKHSSNDLPSEHRWWDSEFLCPACFDYGCQICEGEFRQQRESMPPTKANGVPIVRFQFQC